MSKVQKVQGFGTVSDKSDKVGAAAGVRRWRADGDRLGWEERALAVFVVGVVSCVCVCLDLSMARGLPHQTSSPCSRWHAYMYFREVWEVEIRYTDLSLTWIDTETQLLVLPLRPACDAMRRWQPRSAMWSLCQIRPPRASGDRCLPGYTGNSGCRMSVPSITAEFGGTDARAKTGTVEARIMLAACALGQEHLCARGASSRIRAGVLERVS
jgi:hypothetical protein